MLWWAVPAAAMLAGGWTAGLVLVAAGNTADPTAVVTCGVAIARRVYSGRSGSGASSCATEPHKLAHAAIGSSTKTGICRSVLRW